MPGSVDLSEFAAVGPPARLRICWFKRLTPEQQEKVTAAHEAGYSAPQIIAVTDKWGAKVRHSGVSDHFRGKCPCKK